MSGHLQHQALQLAAALPPLVLEAERVAMVVYQGVHGRRREGAGETFWQFRRYEAGDPVDRIDWRQSARTEKVFVREREWESAQKAYLWADNSGSMQYASHRRYSTKAERARLLSLALASLLLRGGEAIHWMDRQPLRVYGKNGVRRIAEQMQKEVGESLPPLIPLERHGYVVLCSDFLMDQADISALLARYAAKNMRGILVHLLDPSEEQFALQGRVELWGNEGEAPLLLPNATYMAGAYQLRMERHKLFLADQARRIGWFYINHVTDALPAVVVMQLYNLLIADKRT